MATVFTRIIEGELPGRFVWRDERAVAFLSINPLAHGHVLVVPVEEVDHWLDLDAALWQHVSEVTRVVGLGVERAFDPPRVGTIVAGFEVPHVHVHVFPTSDIADFDFARAAQDPDPHELDEAAERIR
ncbi:MAG: HIT family protein, partial [Actinobacteria bacterium]|nr:HIT family protein [Actinomycetota bacterium]NIT99224.1 HIT family protein [Actinomycetota bacterium]NIU22824.1 HIT family protein [Actinomycetota bacterium]NIU71768.1 HIT family protein [Actinomycetota bacterium]NIV59438.1 HIT domain-containing protein [Actinomycetota bacterium]